MTKKLLFIALTLTLTRSLAQDLDGTWRVAYMRSIDTVYSVDNPEDKSQTYEAYRLGNGIFEFNEGRVTIHNFIKKAKTQKIRTDNFLKFKGLNLIIDSSSQDSIILRTEKDRENYITLIPYEPVKLELNDLDFANNQWQVTSDNSFLSSVKFHFSDSTGLICNYQGERFGYANYGEWRIHKSGSYYALYVSDREHFDEYVFYPLIIEGNKVIASFSEPNHLEFPTVSEVELVRASLPTKEELTETKRRIAGNWTFEQFYDRKDTSLIDSLIFIDFSIHLINTGEYYLTNKVNSIVHGRNLNHESNQTGRWILSDNGTYLIMHPSSSWTEYFSIYKLTENNLIIDLNYEYDERSTMATRIIMKRMD